MTINMTGQVIAGRYEIIAELQNDGSRPLYTARDMSLTRSVTIRKCRDIEAMSINVLLRLNEPGLVHVYDVVAFEDNVFVVTPQFDGIPFTALLYDDRRRSIVHFTDITLSVARIMLNIVRLGWIITDLSMRDIYVEDRLKPTITYAVLQRDSDDRRHCIIIGHMLHEMISAAHRHQSMAPGRTNVSGGHFDVAHRLIDKAVRDIADRAVLPFDAPRAYPSFETLVDELIEFCQNVPQQETSAALTAVSKAEPSLDDERRAAFPDSFIASKTALPLQSAPANKRMENRLDRSDLPNVRRMPRKPYIVVGSVIAIALVVGIVWAVRSSHSGIELPDVRGKTIADATAQLQSMGWRGKFVTKKQFVTDGTPTGVILNETPSVGQTIGKGAQVQLIIATASDGLHGGMPQLVGLQASDAYKKMVQLGIPAAHISLKSTTSSTTASGTIVEQTPSQSQTFDPKSSTVTMTIAVSKDETLVPNVLGIPVEQAGQQLIQASLHYHYVIDRPTGVAGTVVDQSPAAGNVVQTQSLVNLHVSSGKGT